MRFKLYQIAITRVHNMLRTVWNLYVKVLDVDHE